MTPVTNTKPPVTSTFSNCKAASSKTSNTLSMIPVSPPASIVAFSSPCEITVISPPPATISKSPVTAASSSVPEIVRLYVAPAVS
ncbi:MAG: hypothetical protein F6K17_25880 [Okeania sp. SIO3C4]|nr:hypothetical protein [Okeania sp. SIO3C4]